MPAEALTFNYFSVTVQNMETASTFRESQIQSIRDLGEAFLREENLAAELEQARNLRKQAEAKVRRNGALRLREPVTVRAGEAGTLVTLTKTSADITGDTVEYVVSKLEDVL